MFNKISNWCNRHQGILSLLSLIAIFYINWADAINSWLARVFNISFNGLSSLLKKNMRIDLFIIVILLYYLIRRFWIYMKTKEISIIKAVYYTPANSVDVTDKIKEFVEKNKTVRFHLSNNLTGVDPEPGVIKNLDINYKAGWVKINKTFGEGEWINLLED